MAGNQRFTMGLGNITQIRYAQPQMPQQTTRFVGNKNVVTRPKTNFNASMFQRVNASLTPGSGGCGCGK